MVSEHMLTVGRDPRNWQAHSKDFSLQLSLSKRPFTSLLFWAYSKYPFLVRPYPFSLLTTKIRLMRPLQEVQDIEQVRSFRNEEDFTVHYNNWNNNGWRLWILEFEGSKEFPDLYDLGRLPLWNLTDYGSSQYPRSRCIGERLKHGALELKGFNGGDINYGMIAHGNGKGRNTAIHEVIIRLCYCHLAELSMHFLGRIG